ncbi:MAG: c-type cytochrome [Candidatus Omnitrophota bacterium]|jgi:hypothetical protein|nr:MAG: c-type cytochrome [Candidatus Omnitrophota bacterium]
MSLKNILYSAALLIALCSLALIASDSPLWSEEKPLSKPPGKNMQVLEFETMVQLQTYMKEITDSLGVTCKYCHEIRDFSRDSEDLHKNKAREMIVMTKEYNLRLAEFYKKFITDEEQLKQKLENKITCFTCHRGKEHPPATKADVEK